MDTLTVAERSARMSLIRSKDTGPEMTVRHIFRLMGFHYRLHSNELPGHPDIVFRKYGKVVFIHGCFWHQHAPCTQYRMPKTKKEFWLPKLKANKMRDMLNQSLLAKMGYKVLIIWECELRMANRLQEKIIHFMASK